MSSHDTHRPEYEELVALHALGALDGGEAERLEAHLVHCERCRDELAQRRGEAAMLADLVEPVEPSEETRASFREALATLAAETGGRELVTEPTVSETTAADTGPAGTVAPFPADAPHRSPEPASGSAFGAWPWAVAAALLLALLGWSWMEQRDLRGDLERMAGRNQALERELARSTEELEGMRTRLASTQAALRAVSDEPLAVLAGLEAAPGSRGRVYEDPGSRRVLVVVGDLPEAPGDRVYQLWGIVGGQPVPAGTFDTESGAGFLVTDAPEEGPVDVWAITEEPAGGVPQPTGAMVLKS